ncbi:MAG: relaxase/mobilization nuclease domain-containing protein [Muribaculum sp.]|nr:relaxase/mobilization nuclease domain-containing protein [Muribaculum sp.]
MRHLETEHPHIHIVYNRVNMDGKAINERNNFKRSDKTVNAIKDKYSLSLSLALSILRYHLGMYG